MVLCLGLLACASGKPRAHAALGWSLGGEAHVFVLGDRFARDLYRELTGDGHLSDSLRRRPLVAVDARARPSITVLSANGAAPARLTLARFHASGACGAGGGGGGGTVTELVLAFPPGGAGGHSTPAAHVTVVALIDAPPIVGGPGTLARPLPQQQSIDLVRQVAERANQGRGPMIGALQIDPDRAVDAGEVALLPRGRYAVGFRSRFLNGADTVLMTGVATTDAELRDLRWVTRPLRLRLKGGTVSGGGRVRYSLRGAVTGTGGSTLLLVDEIAEVSLRDSRATAVDADTRRVLAMQPLALRCP